MALPAAAQKISAADRLAEVMRLNALDAAGMKPWDLRLSFQLYDAEGKPTEQGTFEEVWAAPDRWSVAMTRGERKDVLLDDGGRFFHSEKAGFPGDAELLLDTVTHPLAAENAAHGQPTSEPRTFGSLKTDCLMVSYGAAMPVGAPLGLVPTYCVEDDDALRVTWPSVTTMMVANQMGKFQEHQVPLKLTMLVRQTKVAEAHVEKLELADDARLGFSHEGLLPGRVWTARISSGVMAGLLLKKVDPGYPLSARAPNMSGTVVLRAGINEDGHLRSLHVVQAPSMELGQAAVVAGLQWTYKPYILNGTPTPVETTLMMNFSAH